MALNELARVLRSERLSAGLSQRQPAERAGCCKRMVQYLEQAGRRPRWSLLHVLSLALDPDRAAEIEARLVDATLPDIAVATDGWTRYRRRHYERAVLAGLAPLPSRIAASLREGRGEFHIAGRVFYDWPPSEAARRLPPSAHAAR
jgi:transcriptional regulator with XRE-family HTH domain